MTTVTKLPTFEVRQEAKQLAVQHAETVGRQLLAIGMLEHPKRDELVAEINSGRMLPRIVVNLSGARPLIECWLDLADELGPSVFLFCAGDERDLEAPEAVGKAPTCPGSRRMN